MQSIEISGKYLFSGYFSGVLPHGYKDIRYHFEDLASSNEASSSGNSEVISVEPILKEEISLQECSSAWFLTGRQLVAKFNEESNFHVLIGFPGQVKNTVNIYLGLFRLPQYTTDIVISFNDPVVIHKGKVLERFWALWKELETFLLNQKSAKAKPFVDFMKNDEKMEIIAFLTDITSHLNDLNMKLRGKNSTVCDLMLAVRAFQRKLEVFKCDLQQDLLHFPRLLDQTAGKHHHHNYAEFLDKLIKNFQTRFEDFPLGKQVLLCIENPFLVKNIAEFSNEATKVFQWASAASLQTELIELQENLALQESHCDLVTFWTTYCCESAFSTMNMVKNTYRHTLTNEHLHQCLHLALTPFMPKFKQLVAQRRCHVSH
ncbi:MOG1 factor, partial [Polypterus senegalus]